MKEILTEELKKWYWEYGYKREGVEQIPGNWLSAVYEKDYAIKSINNNQLKPTLAVWGPSQTGKSVLMSKIINSDDNKSSALMWSDELFLFDNQVEFDDDEYIKQLNPHNDGGDASACTSRFYLVDTVNDMEHPVSIKLAEKRDLLHALVEGYLVQFSIEDEDVWTIEQVEDVLDEFPSSNQTPIKYATELIFDFVSVLDRMIASRNSYVSQLKKRDAWELSLKNRILSNRMLCSDAKKAEQFIQTILWKNDELLNNKFIELFTLYDEFSQVIGSKQLKCSLEFASHLLNMDAYQNDEAINKLVNTLELVESVTSNDILITDSLSGKKFFKNKKEFSSFQLLVWELAFPLNENRVRTNNYTSVQALTEFDILDLPGISNFGQSNQPLRPLIESDFSNLIKRGKSASIIYKYSESMSISALLLMIKSGEIVPGESKKQLENGIHSIWSRFNSNYSLGNRESTPIPVSICFSFFIKAISDFIGNKTNPLNNYNSFFDLKEYSNPSNVYSFATNYHWFDKGRSIMVNNAYNRAPEVLMEKFRNVEWVKSRFRTNLEKDSMLNVLKREDGGVSYLINSQQEILSKFDFHTVKKNRRIQIDSEIESLLATVVPTKNDNREMEEFAISNLLNYLDDKVLELEEERIKDRPIKTFEKDVLFLSKGLRYILSCESHELDDIMKLKGINKLGDYYIDELAKWEKSAKRMGILGRFGMSAPEQSLILKLLSTRFLQKDDFTKKYLKVWSGWNNDNRNLSLGEGESYKKIISKQMSNDLYHKKIKYSSPENFNSVIKSCEKLYAKNENYNKFGLVNIHLDSTVPRLIEHLKTILGEVMIPERVEQDGDNKIIELQKNYYAGNKNLSENEGAN